MDPIIPPKKPTVDTAAVKTNVQKLIDAGAPDQDIHDYLEASGFPQQHPAAPPVAQNDVTATTFAPPKEADDGTGTAQHVAEAVVSGFPGAQRAVAGYRGLVELLSGKGIDAAGNEVNNAMDEQRRHVEEMPALARIPLQVAGGAPAAALAAPLGTLAGGAAFGGAAGFDKPAESFSDRVKNTVTGAAFGGAGSVAGEQAGELFGNVLTRTGVTDKAASAIGKVTPKIRLQLKRGVPSATGDQLAATMGTRGQVNNVLSERQDILDAINAAPGSGATKRLSQIAATKEKAGQLYGVARQDKQVLQDPELMQLLEDPQIKPAMQAVSELRAASPNPLPRTAAPAQVPLALQKMGVTPERYAELVKMGQGRSRVAVSGVDVLPPELMGPQATGVELPDPQALSQLKRYLTDVAHGNSQTPLSIKKDAARQLLPKIDRIRSILHEKSEPWAKADAFYADAMGQEEAFTHGYDAVRHAQSEVGDKLPTHSPEAMLKSIEEPRYAGEPVEAMRRRAEAFREGIKASTSDKVRDATVEKGLSSVLGTDALAPTEGAASVRSLMMGSPAEANSLESLIAAKRGYLLAGGGPSIPSMGHSAKVGVIRTLAKPFTKPNLLNSPEGQQALSARLSNPALQASEIAASRQGETVSAALKRLLGTSIGGQVAR